jgi:hypothetical protein
MSDDENNAQEAPESEALKKVDGDSEVKAEESVKSDDSKSKDVEPTPEVEKIAKTKDEWDKEAKKIKEVGRRKAKREAEAEYNQKLEELQKQQATQATQAAPVQTQAPNPDDVYDPVFGWIPKDTTAEQKYNALVQHVIAQDPNAAQTQSNAGASNAQNPPAQPAVAPQQAAGYQTDKETARKILDQIDECKVEYEDFESAINSVGLNADSLPIFETVVETDPEGVKFLYKLAKEDPQKLFKISRLSPNAQRFEIRDLLIESKKAAKKVSQATPQPDPLDTNGSIKSDSDMSFADRRKRELAKQFK